MNRKNYPLNQDEWSLDDPAKRRLVMHMLCYGALGLTPYSSAQAGWFSSTTPKLSEEKSIFTLSGQVQVNGEQANKNTVSRLETA
jgi:hypothetical protein